MSQIVAKVLLYAPVEVGWLTFVIRPQTRLEQRQQLRRVDGTGLTDLPESRGLETLLSGS